MIKMRLFYAVGLDEPVKDALCSAMERMRSCCMKGSVTPRENMHITLAFLGEVVPQRLSAAKDAMNDVTAESFSAEIGGIGCFHRSGGDIYWAGVERSSPLCALYSALCHSLREHGFKVDLRFYRPHLTLMRQVQLKDNCDRSVFTVPAIQMRVEKFSLMLSERRNGKIAYTELASQALRG